MRAGKPGMRVGTTCCLPCATALALMLAPAQTLPTHANQNAQNGQVIRGDPSVKGDRNTQSIQETGTEEITSSPDEPGASADSRTTDHIHVELISVVMPTGGLEFQADARAPFQIRNPGTQTQGPGIQIRNPSVVPVRPEIPQMAEIKNEDVIFSGKFSGRTEQSSRLVGRASNVGVLETATLVLGEENRRYNGASFEKDAIVPGKKNTFTTDVLAEETRTLKLYGKVAPNFYGEYQFTVRPALKISTVRADPSD